VKPARRGTESTRRALVIALLAMILTTGIYINLILRSLERTLPTTLLGQLDYLNVVTQGLSDLTTASALATHQPTPEAVAELIGMTDVVYAELVSMRETFVFDNEVQASAFHAAVAPALVDVRQWLTQGVSGLASDSPLTMRIAHSRLRETWRKASVLRNDSHALAQAVLHDQRGRLDKFISGVNALLLLTFAISAVALILMTRQQRLMRRESEAQAEREFLANILESTSDLVCTATPEGRLTFLNQAARKLLGMSPDEPLDGRVMGDLLPAWGMRKLVAEALPAAAATGPWEGENAVRLQDGREIPVSQVVLVHGAEDAYAGHYSSIMRDISERRRAEARMEETLATLGQAKAEAEAANRTKSEFLANMSHEIRTPINGIMGMLQLLQASRLDGEQTGFATTAVRSCRRLVRLLSDILDLSRIEAGKMTVQIAPMSIRELFCQVGELFSPIAREGGVELLSELDDTIPARVLGDAARLQQVLINMVGNALKFTRQGHVRMEGRALSPLRPGRCRIFFSVSDTGTGISDEKLNLLFKPFSQVDAGYTRTHQGAGLGLSICKRLVELMGGNISVISEEGGGTSMAFALDFEVDARLEHLPPPQKSGTLATLAGLKVLIAEDDSVSAMAGVAMLRKSGALVTHVENGRDALDALRRDSFDLLLMDVQMPVMDGVEATRAIRAGQAGEEARGIPIIALTAYAMAGDRDVFLQAGMNAYVSKPVGIAELRPVIGEILGDTERGGG
jgi:PAS domain S-box-containing protein